MKRTIVLGLTGGIAAYKAPMLARELIKRDFEVITLMTENATNFVTPLSMETVTNNKVHIHSFRNNGEYDVEHIALTKRADAFLIAPASANFLGKIAGGIADDLLTTTVMAAECPVIIAPAMNSNMYLNPIVQENMKKLRTLGYLFVDPGAGFLACGDTGVGRLAELHQLADMAEYATYDNQDYKDKHILVTAGPTIEMIDPIRYLTNRSSGKMGFGIARAARQRGAKVTLVAGPNELTPPHDIDYIPVQTTADMMKACEEIYDACDIVIKAAAPVDFKLHEVFEEKIKKHEEDGLSITLEKNIDVLKTLGSKKSHQKLIGFAAETNNVEKYAKSKLVQKNLDMIVANDVSDGSNGFGGDENRVTFYTADSKTEFAGSKVEVGHAILDKAKEL